jgi:hypothetical protein
MIVACAALIVSLGGVSYAAGVLPKGSVGTAQLQKKAVTASKLRANSVSGLKVKDGTLTATDFKTGQLPAGQQGATGEKGDPGIAQVTVRTSNHSSIPANSQKGADAMCQAGELALGGGASSLVGVVTVDSYHEGPYEAPNGWHVNLLNTTPTPATFHVEVVCAKVG